MDWCVVRKGKIINSAIGGWERIWCVHNAVVFTFNRANVSNVATTCYIDERCLHFHDDSLTCTLLKFAYEKKGVQFIQEISTHCSTCCLIPWYCWCHWTLIVSSLYWRTELSWDCWQGYIQAPQVCCSKVQAFIFRLFWHGSCRMPLIRQDMLKFDPRSRQKHGNRVRTS